MDTYERYGFGSREDYLKSLSEDFGVDSDTVFALADILGEDEDFDALVTELEDYTGIY